MNKRHDKHTASVAFHVGQSRWAQLGIFSLVLVLVSPQHVFGKSLFAQTGQVAAKTATVAAPTKQPVEKPTTTLLSKAWGLHGTFGVDAPAAWKHVSDCSTSKVTVAVIDTGIDPSHEAIKGALWVNEAEANGKPGVDDDGNGFVDDLHGWDFVSKSGNLTDSHGHGTHIAGIIAGTSSDFKGVCPGVRVMSLRYYDPKGSGEDNLKNTIRAIEYAVARGVNIINYSGGGAEYASAEFAALKKAEEKGILVVAAAGNERSNGDKSFYYPAAYNLKNIISVTAIDEKGKVLPSSNWGVKKVHVAAPGQSILSALPNGAYGAMTGTSQATAFVSGVAAMIMGDSPTLQMSEVKSIIESSALKHPNLVGKTRSGARVSALRALEMSRSKRVVAASLPTATTQKSLPLNRDVAAGENNVIEATNVQKNMQKNLLKPKRRPLKF